MAVPDNYRAVSVYLPPQLAEKIEGYAIEHGLTRRSKEGDKPSLGTAIVTLLSIALTGESDELNNVPSPLLGNLPLEVFDRLNRLESLTSQIQSTLLEFTVKGTSALPNNVLDELEIEGSLDSNTGLDSTESLTSKLTSHLPLDTQNITSTLPGNVPLEDSLIPNPQSLIEAEATGLNDEQMANMLTVDVGTVRRWRKGERKPSKANANLFDRWEVRDDLWYQLTTNSGDNQNDG